MTAHDVVVVVAERGLAGVAVAVVAADGLVGERVEVDVSGVGGRCRVAADHLVVPVLGAAHVFVLLRAVECGRAGGGAELAVGNTLTPHWGRPRL